MTAMRPLGRLTVAGAEAGGAAGVGVGRATGRLGCCCALTVVARTTTSSAQNGNTGFGLIGVCAVTQRSPNYGVVTAAVAGFLLLNSLMKARVISMLSAA